MPANAAIKLELVCDADVSLKYPTPDALVYLFFMTNGECAGLFDSPYVLEKDYDF